MAGEPPGTFRGRAPLHLESSCASKMQTPPLGSTQTSVTMARPNKVNYTGAIGHGSMLLTFPPKTRPLARKFACAEMGPRGGGHDTETASACDGKAGV
jgi:hypothetical protein